MFRLNPEESLIGFLVVQNLFGRPFKNVEMRGARRSMSGGVLWSYVDAKSIERNEAGRRFGTV
jgi:hypothetical protein